MGGTDLGAIPDELRRLRRWVGVEQGSKCPMRVSADRRASVSLPATWGTFDEAASCIEAGIYDFLGFVFAGDGLVGIDIDHAFDDEGMILPEAAEAVRACASYAEVSKSGSALHIVCRADIPFKGRKEGRWEIYREARYFVLTGWTLGRYTAIADAQDAVDAILAEHFPRGERDGSGGAPQTIWEPEWPERDDGRIQIAPVYPDVSSGSRHLALVSFCGQQWGAGASREELERAADRANREHLLPPLPDDEVEQIIDSITRYRR